MRADSCVSTLNQSQMLGIDRGAYTMTDRFQFLFVGCRASDKPPQTNMETERGGFGTWAFGFGFDLNPCLLKPLSHLLSYVGVTKCNWGKLFKTSSTHRNRTPGPILHIGFSKKIMGTFAGSPQKKDYKIWGLSWGLPLWNSHIWELPG